MTLPRTSLIAGQKLARYAAVTAGVAVVAIPLLYLQAFGRYRHIHSDLGWTDYERLYGWPIIHGTRQISEPWFSDIGPKTIKPLQDFSVRALAVNVFVSILILVGTAHAIDRIFSVARARQFSMRSLAMLCLLAVGVGLLIKYDRYNDPSSRLDALITAIQSGTRAPPENPPISESPAYVWLPMLFGCVAGIHMVLEVVARLLQRSRSRVTDPGDTLAPRI